MDTYVTTGIRPVGWKWAIGSRFGEKREKLAAQLNLKSKVHRGIDFLCPVGTEVMCYLDGTAQIVGEDAGFGYRVWVYHDLPHRARAIRTCYAHLSEIKVKEGQKLKMGDIVGLSGGAKGAKGSGKSTGAHLHFEARVLPQDEPYEPKFFEPDGGFNEYF